ncbi:hypothetical protein M404DRAFT_29971 [Pisolithus tinctorius Marx 270]|uniref:Uncharacterized protein n=1 Tax=Pisolithus tinctorius Marx 270 TaxID=870435 RepID=A0A0C3ISP8_PISTI|nr:hypothetical protein M404DRAFT_29971 [Pisolithus tinctorius Marx 270]
MVKQDYRCLAYHPPMLTTVLEERDLNNGGCKRTLSFPLACSKSHPEKRTHKKGNESNFETLSLPYGIPFGRLTTLPHSSQPHSPSTTSLLRTETSSFPQTFQAVYLQLPVLVP